MGVAGTLAKYLIDRGVAYDVVPHSPTETAWASAETSHISADCLAKAVVLKGEDGFMLAVLPASRRIRFKELGELLGSDMDLANEEQVETLFVDCDPGAVPPLGAAYGLKVIIDDSLMRQPDVYFEGGDHASLVHISGPNLQKLMADARHGQFAD